MSGPWLSAANRTRLYAGRGGDQKVSNMVTRSVLREMCSMANPAGVLAARQDRIAARVGIKDRALRLALRRLQVDGWIAEVRRGVGNPHWGVPSRTSVYVLARVPDWEGTLWPQEGQVLVAWLRFVNSSRLFASIPKADRPPFLNAHVERMTATDHPPTPVDNGPFGMPTTGTQTPYNRHVHAASKTSEEHQSGSPLARDTFDVIAGGRPDHWRSGASRPSSPLEVIPSDSAG